MDLFALLAAAILAAVAGWLLLAYLLSRPHGRRRRR